MIGCERVRACAVAILLVPWLVAAACVPRRAMLAARAPSPRARHLVRGRRGPRHVSADVNAGGLQPCRAATRTLCSAIAACLLQVTVASLRRKTFAAVVEALRIIHSSRAARIRVLSPQCTPSTRTVIGRRASSLTASRFAGAQLRSQFGGPSGTITGPHGSDHHRKRNKAFGQQFLS